ncbi:bifunctional biotin--[acetyl-CoA-carboxylase] ligase/biotin operon repressor BirA [Thalassotalea sp. 1_MG-2023]|uniref:bifunctional biotin--[acetyl-CoA-carboxylase] ligase/biotin operon repressor BirA n=1 Tax=Thalassotalea sp. 1_MG-2023 TaxID=3062680 RepID=UPI0026E2AC8D|nr:bifunctional biotin--[acetyl-CoA-carboxylase] ligase/biotin operon repressor BirA [Thalassotalea sp. 1_MG-2023]MDO6425650.1 bifunctional biotin--[acetyl-CoA-carboxylase] ligase/biotin operon repressor BirA [Thalassotalea sp. 1_MG-2023]
MANLIKEKILIALADGQFVSGESLGERFGISRAAVSKHIKGIGELGIDVFRVSGKGYRLAQPINMLDKRLISEYIDQAYSDTVIETNVIIDSTNSELMRRIPSQLTRGQVCIAECQTAGRGRRGREWVSPFGSHVYMSMYWYLEQGMSAAMGLSMVTALAVSDAIKSLYDIDVGLKWPNDIYLKGVKLAGILIELEGQALDPCHCVIGLGVNVNMPNNVTDKIDQQWTDLQSHVNNTIERNQLTACIINKLRNRISQHERSGLVDMVEDWQARDQFINQPVKLITGVNETHGICRGINSQGALLLEVDNKVQPIYGGEVSLRGLA